MRGLGGNNQQLGGALGVAALVAIATAHTSHATTTDPAAAFTDGFSVGLLGGAVIAAVAGVLAATLLPGGGSGRRPEPAAAAAPAHAT